MKTFSKKYFWLALALAIVRPAAGEPAKNPSAKPPVPARSVFTLPANATEGRDPFYPESTRPYVDQNPASHTVEITDLTVKGFSVMNGRPMVIINNHSFMVGDEGDVLTPGGRVHVRCLEIRTGVAIIEVNGLRHELQF